MEGRAHTIWEIRDANRMTKRTLDSAEDLDAYLALAEECARGAGKMIRDAHDARSTGLAGVESKGSEETETVDLVTATDKACEDCAPPSEQAAWHLLPASGMTVLSRA